MAENLSNIEHMFARRRRELGLSQEAVGQRIGVGRARISRIESGKGLNFGTIGKVADALGADVDVQVKPRHKADRDKLHYTMMAISLFAERHALSRKSAALYLTKYKGIDYLDDYYEVEHTLSFDDCLDHLGAVCRKNGGGLPKIPGAEHPIFLRHGGGVELFDQDMTDEKTFKMLLDFLTAAMAGFLMADNEGMSMSEAVQLLHTSEWYDKASQPQAGLYYRSAAYNYERLKHELKYGSLG